MDIITSVKEVDDLCALLEKINKKNEEVTKQHAQKEIALDALIEKNKRLHQNRHKIALDALIEKNKRRKLNSPSEDLL